MNPTLLNFLICMAAAGFFSLARSYADNLSATRSGWPLARLYLGKFLMGVVGGFFAPPLADITRQMLPLPSLREVAPHSVMLAAACVIGWAGLPATMQRIETWLTRLTHITKTKKGKPHASVSDLSDAAPHVPDRLEDSGSAGDRPAGTLGPPEDQ